MLLKTNNKFKKVLSLFLAFVVIIGTLSVSAFALTDEERKEKQAEKEKLQQEIEANEKKIAELEAKAAEYDDDVAALQDKIAILQSQIDLYNKEIAVIDADIEKIQLQINDINDEIKKLQGQIKKLDDEIIENEQAKANTYKILGERIRASYMSGPSTSLEYLLTSDEFEFVSYLERVELLQRIAEKDDETVTQLENIIIKHTETIEEIENVKARHNTKIEELDVAKSDYESKKQEKVAVRKTVEDSQAEYNADLEKIKGIVAKYDAQSDKLKAANDKRDEAMMKLDEEMAGKNLYYGSGNTNGKMRWPLPGGDVYISSSYKWRWGRMHNGIDTCRWSGTQGADVVACADGTIESAGWNGGYGNLIIVNHGEGVLSYYAHLSGYNCSVGEKVKAGKVIGYAGNTGYSFGAHLHFGLMINGSWVDPVEYLHRYDDDGDYIQHTDADGH